MSPTVPPISEITTSAGITFSARRIASLDLVRDVRNHLDGRAEELAFPLLAQDRLPDRTGRVARVPREVLVDESLVMADVEVGLGTVLGHEHLAVLERAHRPGIDVQVRVELLRAHGQAARFQETSERCRDDALPERGHHATRDKNELGHGIQPYQALGSEAWAARRDEPRLYELAHTP